MPTRFYRQTNDFSCGPVAVYNLMKLMGAKGSFRENKDMLMKLCNCDKDGMEDTDMSRVLWYLSNKGKKFTIKKYTESCDFSERKLFEAMSQPKTVAILATYSEIEDAVNETESHYFLCVKPRSVDLYVCFNYATNITVAALDRKMMRDALNWHKIKKNKEYPSIWILSNFKKENEE